MRTQDSRYVLAKTLQYTTYSIQIEFDIVKDTRTK